MKKNILSTLVYFACFALIFTVRAHAAYLDPSVMTYTIQVVAGIVIAVGATVGIYYRRAKKKVQTKLGIDENAGKEKEEELVINEDDAD